MSSSPRPTFMEPTIHPSLSMFRGTMLPLPPSPLSPLRSLQGNSCSRPQIEISHEIDMLTDKVAETSIHKEIHFGFETPKRPISKVSVPRPVEFEYAEAKAKQGQKRRASYDCNVPSVVRMRFEI